MKKILLAALNARYSHSNPALFYLRRAADGLPFEIRLAEFSINKDIVSIADQIYLEKPDIVGLSVYIWNSLYVKKLIPLIHELLPKCLIILGGPEVSFSAEEWLVDFPYINHIIVGAGESAFRMLLVNDFACEDKIVFVPNPKFADITFPYQEDDFERLKNRYIYYESARGCPHACSFCLSSRSDSRPQYRNMNNVKAELDFLMRGDPRYIKFVDRTFNANKRHSREIWSYIIERFSERNTCFHFEIFPAFLNEDDFAILQKARDGLFQFEAGIQSIHEKTLAAVNRMGSWNEIKQKLTDILHKTKIHLHVDIISGLPFEDIKAFAKSFNEVYALEAHHFQTGFLKVLPGTEMRERAHEFGLEFQKEPPYTVLANNWLCADELKLLRELDHSVNALYNSHVFTSTLEALIPLFGSAFDMFVEITAYIARTKKKINRDRFLWTELVQDFTLAKKPEARVQINEALRRDKLIDRK